MARSYNQSSHHWLVNLEVGVTVIWLLYFLDVALPHPFPSLFNALSYPIILVLVILNWKRLSWIAIRDLPLLLLVITVLASIFWSDNLGNTLDSCRGFVRMFLFGAYFTARYSLKEQMKILAWVFGLAAILSLAVALVIPSYGQALDRSDYAGAWQGIFAHKSKLGDVMSIGAIFFLLNALKDKKLNWLAWIGFCLTSTINLLTFSSSSLISFVILLLLIPLYKVIKQQYKLRTIILSLGCILIGSIAVIIVSNLDTILVEVLGEGLTFNGRIPIWTLMSERVLEERPWLGYGYDAFWSSDAGTFVARYAWEEVRIGTEFNAHSSYMELFAGLGLLGILVYAISLGTVFFRTVNLLLVTKKIQFFWFIQFLVFAHIAAFSNVGKIVASGSSYWVIYVSICLSTAVEWRHLRINQKQYLKNSIKKIEPTYDLKSKIF